MDTEEEPEVNPESNKPEIGELKSKPSFRVDMVRGDTTVTVSCSFATPGEEGEDYSK